LFFAWAIRSASSSGSSRPVDHVCATESLTDEEKSAILGGNAARLFGMNG
jgi:hypothetical protein